MSIKQLLFIFYITLTNIFIYSQNIPKKKYTTQLINNRDELVIDGKLNDVIWENENWESNFIQREPNENITPSEQTSFNILYDSKFMYIAVKCLDSQPNKIANRMSRRDGFEGDLLELIIDSYHDLRSAFSFTITAAGVKGDKIISLNGANEDTTWNPIWYAESTIDENGWTAEMKIPLSQLRFGKVSNQIWGLQVVRKLFRNQETSVWQRVPLDATGWISEFGELHGIINIRPQKQFEIQPYILTSLKTIKKEPLNPYKDSNITLFNAGIDGKIGITNDLTLDFTINPDFGQVEADPAAIALDGFQLFFKEQRPFFVENKNIFNYQFSNPKVNGGVYTNDNLFYSRRIGRNPQGSVFPSNNEFVESPEQTTILGAVKFSGKTKNGWSIGIMETVTANEYAKVSNNGEERKELVEPLTNYFVGRIQKDFNNKNTFVGGILTSTIRDLDDNVSSLHKTATTAGLDFFHQWKEREWYLETNLVMSHVEGSKEAILNTQTSIPHLFQRTDANHIKIDSTKTSLTGTGGNIRFGKAGKGHLKFESGVTWRSPEVELNDVGFMREADYIISYTGATYSSLKPFGIFRKGAIDFKQWAFWDFEGNLNFYDWDIETSGIFKNNWYASFGIYHQPFFYLKSFLRGGPRMYTPNQYGAYWSLGSDSSKKLSIDLDGWTKTGGSDAYFLLESGISLNYQPLNQLKISLAPRYVTTQDKLQYNYTTSYNQESRYITSRLNQGTASIAFRLNYTINNNLSIQYYAEPYITKGDYTDFNYVANPLAKSHREQLVFYNQNQITNDANTNQYLVDENQDNNTDYSFSNPDFSFAQFKSNLVVRYEYKPGSEIFLVWSQGVVDDGVPNGSLRNSFNEQIINNQFENTFLIKATYRFF